MAGLPAPGGAVESAHQSSNERAFECKWCRPQAAEPPARFFLDRGCEPNLITRDVGRIFFGRDMQCAQCHNHPLVKDYEQSDYYGLLAFISPGYAVTRKEGKKTSRSMPRRRDRPQFDSVFVKNDKHVTGPEFPAKPSCLNRQLLPAKSTR